VDDSPATDPWTGKPEGDLDVEKMKARIAALAALRQAQEILIGPQGTNPVGNALSAFD
jgi:hypothetical protein